MYNQVMYMTIPTVGIQSLEIGKKVLDSFDNVFHVYLMNGLQKYLKKKNSRHREIIVF